MKGEDIPIICPYCGEEHSLLRVTSFIVKQRVINLNKVPTKKGYYIGYIYGDVLDESEDGNLDLFECENCHAEFEKIDDFISGSTEKNQTDS